MFISVYVFGAPPTPTPSSLGVCGATDNRTLHFRSLLSCVYEIYAPRSGGEWAPTTEYTTWHGIHSAQVAVSVRAIALRIVYKSMYMLPDIAEFETHARHWSAAYISHTHCICNMLRAGARE